MVLPDSNSITINMCNHDLHLEAGLLRAGKDEEGRETYLGNDEQWKKFEELEAESIMSNYPQQTPEEELLGENQEVVEK